ncbi:MAG: ABC transporter permease [Candidatus Kapaibacterium sp.]
MMTFFEFIRKEIYHIRRDYRTLLVLFGMPIAQIILFGFAIRTEISDADIGILDKSRDYYSKMMTDKLLSSGYFRLQEYFDDEGEIPGAFKSGEVRQVVVFQPGFGHDLMKEGRADIQIINDASNPNVASILNSYTSAIITDFQRDMAGDKPLLIEADFRMYFNPEMKSVYMFVPGLITLILMLVSALMTSIAITREKELGTMEVLLVSPLRPATIILGKVMPYVAIAFINAITILIISMTVFGLPFRGSYLLFTAEVLLFIVTALSLGILISTIAKTQQIALMVSLAGLLMPTVLLSGFIFPIENMPIVLQYISKIIPATWFLIILKNIMLKGVGIEYFWKETLILAGFAVVFLAISMKKFKIRLE